MKTDEIIGKTNQTFSVIFDRAVVPYVLLNVFNEIHFFNNLEQKQLFDNNVTQRKKV